MEYEIDLAAYGRAVLRRWYWVILATVLAAALAVGVSLVLPKTFTATAPVLALVRQTGSQVGVNQPILNIETIDVGARRQGLLALAQSETIATRIAPETLQQVGVAGYKPGQLVQRIEVTANGDLLEIRARAATPEQAQLLADTWASTYVAYVGQLYTDEHSSVQLAGSAALPYRPSSPRVALNAALASGAALLLASIAAIISELTGFTLLRRRAQARPAGRPAARPNA